MILSIGKKKKAPSFGAQEKTSRLGAPGGGRPAGGVRRGALYRPSCSFCACFSACFSCARTAWAPRGLCDLPPNALNLPARSNRPGGSESLVVWQAGA